MNSPDVVQAVAVSEDGTKVALEIEVSRTPPSVIRVRRGQGPVAEHTGDDLFHCLHGLRQALEADGLLLCCQGARPDVFPSGMDRQMGEARHAHVLGLEAGQEESVDIFAPADVGLVGTIEEQRIFVRRAFGLDKKR